MTKQLYTLEEVSPMLGLTGDRLRAMCRAGEVAWTNNARRGAKRPRYCFTPAQIEVYLTERAQPKAGETKKTPRKRRSAECGDHERRYQE